jgi:hypothetical protein
VQSRRDGFQDGDCNGAIVAEARSWAASSRISRPSATSWWRRWMREWGGLTRRPDWPWCLHPATYCSCGNGSGAPLGTARGYTSCQFAPARIEGSRLAPVPRSLTGSPSSTPQSWGLTKLARQANVLRPQTAHLPPDYFIGNPGPFTERVCFEVWCHTGVVYEYCFAPIVRLDETVTTILIIKPTPDDPHPLA